MKQNSQISTAAKEFSFNSLMYLFHYNVFFSITENDSSRFLSTSIEGPNNITVNVKHAVESITHTLLDHIVAHRFGDKPRRIFR